MNRPRTHFAFLLASLMWCGCSGAESELVIPPEPPFDAGDGGTDALVEGSVADGADARVDGSRDDADAETAPVVVGVQPLPRAVEQGESEEAARTDAILTSMAAGARGFVVSRSWADLTSPSSVKQEDAWSDLTSLGELYASQRRQILLSVRTVHGGQDQRPADIQGTPWDGPATRQAIHRLIDWMFETFRGGTELGGALRFLSLGLDVDTYLEAHPEAADEWTSFALDALSYAIAHPNRPTDQIGMTWSAATWTSEEPVPTHIEQMASISGAVMLTYYPLDETNRVREPSAPTTDLATLMDRIKQRPIVLQHVGYPSSPLIGGSEEAQAQFVDELFGAIESRRHRFPFVAMAALHDPAPEACVDFATSRGQPDSLELFTFWCSAGIRRRDGQPKSSFGSFVAAAASYLDP